MPRCRCFACFARGARRGREGRPRGGLPALARKGAARAETAPGAALRPARLDPGSATRHAARTHAQAQRTRTLDAQRTNKHTAETESPPPTARSYLPSGPSHKGTKVIPREHSPLTAQVVLAQRPRPQQRETKDSKGANVLKRIRKNTLPSPPGRTCPAAPPPTKGEKHRVPREHSPLTARSYLPSGPARWWNMSAPEGASCTTPRWWYRLARTTVSVRLSAGQCATCTRAAAGTRARPVWVGSSPGQCASWEGECRGGRARGEGEVGCPVPSKGRGERGGAGSLRGESFQSCKSRSSQLESASQSPLQNPRPQHFLVLIWN